MEFLKSTEISNKRKMHGNWILRIFFIHLPTTPIRLPYFLWKQFVSEFTMIRPNICVFYKSTIARIHCGNLRNTKSVFRLIYEIVHPKMYYVHDLLAKLSHAKYKSMFWCIPNVPECSYSYLTPLF